MNLSENAPDQLVGAGTGQIGSAAKSSSGPALVYTNPHRKVPKDSKVYFDKKELGTLLNLYGQKVSAGEWRDYAMDFLKDRALFSVYKRNSEQPMFVIEKQPKLRARQGQYLVTNQAGRVLKRGHELQQVLKVLAPSFVVIK